MRKCDCNVKLAAFDKVQWVNEKISPSNSRYPHCDAFIGVACGLNKLENTVRRSRVLTLTTKIG